MNKEEKNVRLVKVDTKNFDDLIDLEVNEEQKNYVARQYLQPGRGLCHKSGREVCVASRDL